MPLMREGKKALLTLLLILLPSVVCAAQTPAIDNYDSFDTFFSSYQPYLGNIGPYQPMYFLVGTDPSDSAFQFSLKYRFYQKEGVPEEFRWMNHLYFGYTQTSFWDLKSDSKPFEDTSYKPELFFLTSNLRPSGSFPFVGFFIQGGYQHESNGQAEPLSRSTNYLYVQPIMMFYHRASGYGLRFSPKIWCYVMNDDDTNEDLDDYRGYMDLQLKFGRADNIVCDSHLWIARKGVSFQFDMSYPIDRHLDTGLKICLYAQYANRRGESLRYYTERTKVLRAGVSIVR